ncbi:farnesol dehydrogenase-like [Wyeomyia smithii]|uniref:farnesol dehydrogenase-like n=1 Tax=Wyeomyia smithii TaxID=174621 RepID=UPI002467E096|nr:farnesol dehydrogenase-like [Wyeomyia smithii]
MDRWTGKVAVVTGASSGIGSATVKELIKAGMVVVGLARRVERVEALRSDLPAHSRERLHAVKCDISKEEDILNTFRWIEGKLGGVDVLINNAGVALGDFNLIDPGNTETIRKTLDTNVVGLVICSREAFQSMKKRSFDGHIVHINSVAGHVVPPLPRYNIYSASKFAVTAITETMRQEFRAEGTKVKVTSISPGAIDTEMLNPEFKAAGIPTLEAKDIAEAILYVLSTPPRVQVHELTIKPVGEGF